MTRLAIPTIAVLLTACHSASLMSPDGSRESGVPPTGGGGGSAGGGLAEDGGNVVDGGGQALDAGIGTTASECIEQPTAKAGATARVTVNVDLSYAGNPVAFGEPFALPMGTLTLTNFRFYISEVMLTPAAGDPVPVDLVGSDGAPVPYDVVLVNAEDPSSLTFQIAAPSGSYEGVSFLVGITDSCNASTPASRSAPLSYESQMTWPPPFGYLFLRYAAQIVGAPATDTTPRAIDMGGFPRMLFAPRAAAPGGFVAGQPGTVHLRVALDELFRAASLPVQLNDAGEAITSGPASGGALLVGQHVLQNIKAVSIFSVTQDP